MIQPSIPSSPNRCRFIVHLAFPSSGIFRISIFINGPGVWKSNIEVKQSCNHFMPFLHYPIDDSRFIPIVPKQLLSNVEDGIGVIRFVARKESSKVLMEHFCLEGEDWSDDNWNNGEEMKATIWDYGRMIIEYDKELYEIIITITFPKDGRYKSLLYLSSADDQDSFHLFTNFYFDVKNSKKRSKVSPYELIFEGQKFVPIEEKDIQIEPSDSAIITNNPSFEIACSVNKGSTLVLNLNDPHQQTIFGIQRGK